ncbi:hypothetical protein TWF730_005020 [Orbilia blumenaviensis]|uniref:Nephrocystin 3-like N-terminal domain-containing protein n=1 Tax=Orbilia blumenaviensis TaxID=1796055 RepID=A0AAV9VJH3_9PEZI
MALELAAAIAGLIALADVAVVKASKYRSLYKNGISESQGLIKELINLQGALYSLEKAVKFLNSLWDTGYRSVKESKKLNSLIYIKDCQDCILELGKILDKIGPEDVSTWEKVKASLKWPLSASETREFAQRVQRLKSTISLGLEADSLEALCRILSTQKRVQEGLQRVEREQIRIAKERAKKTLDLETRTKLDEISAYKCQKHAQMVDSRHPGTAIWFRDCEEYKNWLREPNSALWFDGIPGAGKSVLTSAVIEDLQLLQSDTIGLAYFYIEYSSQESQDFRTVTASLLRQLIEPLLSRCPSNGQRDILDNLHNQYHRNVNFDPQTTLGSFKMVSEKYSTTMLVIDGLDECDKTDDRRKLLQFLSEFGKSPLGSIKVIVTSRTIHDIQNSLVNFANISIAATSTDVKLFVASELEQRLRSEVEFYSIRLQDPGLKAEIISALVDKSNGMFQWVRAQLDTLSRISGDNNKRAALQDLPRDLPETYRRIMKRVDKANHPLVRTAVLWIHSQDNTNVQFRDIDELIDFTGLYIKDHSIGKKDVLSNCGGLIKLLPSGEVHLSHFSVWEFLTSTDEKKNNEWYYTSVESAEEFEDGLKGMFFNHLEVFLWDAEGIVSCNLPHNTSHTRLKPASREKILNFLLHMNGEEDSFLERLLNNIDSGESSESRTTLVLNIFGMVRRKLDELLPSFSMTKSSIEDIAGLELFIACFLRPYNPQCIRTLVEDRGCDTGRRVMGGLTAAHILVTRLLLVGSESAEMHYRQLDNFAETWGVIVTPETADYQLLFLLDELYRHPGIDIFNFRMKEALDWNTRNFRDWASSRITAPGGGPDWFHKHTCQQLRKLFQPDSGVMPAWSTRAFKGFVNDYDGFTGPQYLPNTILSIWEALIFCRDLFPAHGLSEFRQWFEIVLQGHGFAGLLSELQRDSKETKTVTSPYDICNLLVDTKELTLLHTLLRRGIGHILTYSEVLALLDKLLVSDIPTNNQKTKTGLETERELPQLPEMDYFKAVFSLIRHCKKISVLSNPNLWQATYIAFYQFLQRYISPYNKWIRLYREKEEEEEEEEEEGGGMEKYWGGNRVSDSDAENALQRVSYFITRMVEIKNSDDISAFVATLSVLSDLQLDDFLDLVGVDWESHRSQAGKDRRDWLSEGRLIRLHPFFPCLKRFTKEYRSIKSGKNASINLGKPQTQPDIGPAVRPDTDLETEVLEVRGRGNIAPRDSP